jgi:Flp pilus assembly protein TadD
MARYHVGVIHERQQHLDQAAREFRASMDEGIGEVSSVYHLAMIHRAQGDEDTATSLLDRAREFGRAAAAR